MEQPSKGMLEMQAKMQADLPRQNQRGRPVSRETKVGRLISDRQLRVYAIAANANISPRVMSEYCAGRRSFSQHHLLALCRVLEVTPDQILEDEDLEGYEDEVTELTDAESSTGGIHTTKSITDLQREHARRLGNNLPGPAVSRLRQEAQ